MIETILKGPVEFLFEINQYSSGSVWFVSLNTITLINGDVLVIIFPKNYWVFLKACIIKKMSADMVWKFLLSAILKFQVAQR